MLNRIDQPKMTIEQSKGHVLSQTKIENMKNQVRSDNKRDEKLSAEKARTMVEGVNDFLASTDSQLKFVYHDELNEYYVTIVNTATDEVIREIPSKKLMDIHAAMKEFVGLLVDRKI